MSRSEKHTDASGQEDRSKEILDAILSFARLDFSKKVKLGNEDDVLQAVGAGVNMLGEELENSTISLKEKDQIIREIHHRVKNNLQIVSSLLNLQATSKGNMTFEELVLISRNRINSIALVHEMLYTSMNPKRINMNQYVRRLSRNIHDSLSKPDQDMKFTYGISEELFLDTDRILPFGLIINELITNSFKYAFPEQVKGNIRINAERKKERFFIEYSDNGIGLPGDFEKAKESHLGLQLVEMLVQQLDGELLVKTGKESKFTVIFR